MRYFAIVKPLGRYVLADADPVETAPGQPRNGTIETAEERCLSNWLNQINRPLRQRHLSPRRSQ